MFQDILYHGITWNFNISGEGMNFSRLTLNSSESSMTLRDRQQIIFVTLNGSNWKECQPRLNEKKTSLLYMLYFNFEKVLLWKVIRCSYQFFYFLFYISFDISRYHFLKLFRTWFNIIWKKIFVANLPFLMNSPNSTPPTPLMAKIC